MNITADIAERLAAASRALGRLDAVLMRSPVAEGWRWRAAIQEAADCASLDGPIVAPERVAAAAAGLPMKGEMDLGGTQRGLVLLVAMGSLATVRVQSRETLVEAAAELIEDVEAAARSLAGHHPAALLSIMIGAGEWLRGDGPQAPLRIAIAKALMDQGVLSRFAPAVTAGPALRTHPDHREFPVRFLTSLERQANTATTDTLDLHRRWIAWHRAAAAPPAREHQVHRMGARRRTSRIDRLVDLLAAAPALGAAQVAGALGMTTAGASLLLEQLAGLGIVQEVTGRRTWKLYMPQELRGTVGHVQRPKNRPRLGPRGATPAPAESPADRRVGQGLLTMTREEREVQEAVDALFSEEAKAPAEAARLERRGLQTDISALLLEADRASRKVGDMVKAYAAGTLFPKDEEAGGGEEGLEE